MADPSHRMGDPVAIGDPEPLTKAALAVVACGLVAITMMATMAKKAGKTCFCFDNAPFSQGKYGKQRLLELAGVEVRLVRATNSTTRSMATRPLPRKRSWSAWRSGA